MSTMTLEQVRDKLRQYAMDSVTYYNKTGDCLEFFLADDLADAIDALLRERESAKVGVTELENALRMCVSANAMLSEIEDGKTLYEGSPTHSTRCLLAWSNLNTAIANAKQVLAAAPKPEKE